MCEEVKNPSVAVPRSIMFSISINGIMGLAMVIAMLFSATDIDAALDSSTGYPYIEIFHQATGSRTGTAVMAALIIFMTLSAIVGVIAATSRMFWAFARDRGLPCWRTLSKVCLNEGVNTGDFKYGHSSLCQETDSRIGRLLHLSSRLGYRHH